MTQWKHELAHEDCPRCVEMAQAAIGTARATGSTGGSYTDGQHSARVTRIKKEVPL